MTDHAAGSCHGEPPCRPVRSRWQGGAELAAAEGAAKDRVDGQRDRSCPCRPWRRVVLSVADAGFPGIPRGARTHGGRRRSRIAPGGLYVLVSGVFTRMGGERSVKPSAQPTLVRTQHLPPPAKTPPWLRILALAGRFFSVPACVTLSRCRSSYCAAHGRIADRRPCCKDGRWAQLRRPVHTVGCSTDGHGRAALTAFFRA